MRNVAWKGIYTVLVTPFRDDLSLDLDSLKRQVDFCVDCGVHGIVSPIVASEFFTLTDEERISVIKTVAEQVAGRVPYVAGTAGASTQHAVLLSRLARDLGADALVAMPPYCAETPMAYMLDYFAAISDATDLPIMIQNPLPPLGSPLDADSIVHLAKAGRTVRAVKEETKPNPQSVGALLGAANRAGVDLAVLGASAGIHFLNELERGAHGSMPACEFAEVAVRVYELFMEGEIDAAHDVFAALEPALVMEHIYFTTFMKTVLKRRGVISSTAVRTGEPQLDTVDMKMLDRIMSRLEPHFTWNAT